MTLINFFRIGRRTREGSRWLDTVLIAISFFWWLPNLLLTEWYLRRKLYAAMVA